MTNTSAPTKTCTKCGEEKPATTEYFHRDTDGKYGLNARCKPCILEPQKQYRQKNRERRAEYARKYYQENRIRHDEYQRKYNQDNREQVAERKHKYYLKYRDRNKDSD